MKGKKMNHGLRRLVLTTLAMFGLSGAAFAVTSTSPEFRLDIKESGIRQSAGDETLTYSSLWDGDANATVTIAQDGVAIAEGLTGEDTYAWGVTRNGTYMLTHTTYTNGVAGKVETATFVVSGKDVPFAPGDVTVTGCSEKYDGAAHGITVASAIEGFAVKYCDTQDGEFAAEAPTLTDVGSMTVWCELSAPGYITETNSTTVTISKREVTLTSESDSKVYDGAALVKHEVVVSGDGFAANEGASYGYTGSQTSVGESENTFAYTLNDGTKAGNYTITTVNGALTVTKATVGPGGGGSGGGEEPDEPGAGEIPVGGESKYDVTAMYDGEGHTIDTNALVAAFGSAMIGDATVEYAVDDGSGANGGVGHAALPWLAEAPVYTNAGEYVVWYRVTNPNYNDFEHAAKETITNRPVTVTSADGYWTYDGLAHSNVTVTATGFVDGEGVTTNGFAMITDVGSAPNAFGYAFAEGTLAENYHVTCVTGMLVVATADMDGWTDESKWVVTLSGDGEKYDGAERACEVTAVAYDGFAIPTFNVSGNTATDAGDYTLTVTGTGNFSGSHSFPWSITKRVVTLTSGSANKVYDGTPLVKHEVVVGGDGSAANEGATYDFTGSQTGVGESENVFTYTLNDGTKAGNYTISTVNGTLTVTKATVGPGGGSGGGGGEPEEPGAGAIPVGGESKFDVTVMYDGEGHTIDTNALFAAFGASMIGGFSCVYAQGQSPALQWQAEAPVYTNAGEYVVWYNVTNPNYNDFTHAAKVTITNRPVTVVVTGHSATYTYDTTEKRVSGYEATTEDVLYDIAADTAFGGAALAARTDVGTTAMGLSASDFSNNNANFTVTYAVTDGGLTINPRVIGDNPANWDIRLGKSEMYDGTEKTAPIIQVCYVKPDSNLDNIPYALSGNTATNAGNYVVSITGTGNYAGTIEKDWAIMPRNVTLTSGSANWTYDGAPHSQTAISVTGDGFVAGEGASYSGFPVATHVTDAATPIANAFSYTLNVGTKAGNYAITTANGTVQMTPRAITLTAPTKGKPYDGTPLTFAANEVAVSGDGYANGESFALSGFSSITEAGRVDATFAVADGTALMGDYAITAVPGSLTVTKSATEITVTAKSGNWTYDGAAHVLHEYEATNLGTLIAGDVLDVAFSDESVVTTPVDGVMQNGVVENTITSVCVMRGSTDVTANYTLAAYPGTLTVTKRPVTLASKSDTKVYDGTPLTAHEVTVGGDGFVGADGAIYSFTGTQTDKGTSKNTFAYTLKSGTNAAFYEIAKVEGDLEVTALDISNGSAGDWAIAFGQALTYTGLEQIQTLSSVTYKGLPLDCSVTGNARTDAGTYQMTLTGQGNFTGEHVVEWSIAPKALTLTAGSGSRVYDGTAFTVGAVTASGFVANEGAEYECTGSQTDVGGSPNVVGTISWSANTKGSNYAVTKVAGVLVVTPRPVTLTAANISKPYDGTPLALTAADISASGLVAGESFVYSGFASRTEAGQTPATFSYAAGPGTSLGNYFVTVTQGRTITVTKSATAISVTAASGEWVYDGETHSNRTWTATNLSTLQSGDALEVTFDPASVVTTPQDGPAQNGIVANVITGVRVMRGGTTDVTANYTVEWFPGSLTVTKRPVTVTVTGHTATHTYDGTEKTVTGYDIATEDTLYDISAATAFNGGDEVKRTDAGKTDMGLSEGDFANGNDCFEVTYAVTDGWVKIEPADISTDDTPGDFSLVLGANPKYNGTVQTIPVVSATYKGLPVTYTLAGENATHAGTYTLTVKGDGNFTGERSTTWQMLKRVVTLTSGSANKVYDGTPLANGSVAVGGDGFIGLEGATFEVTGSQTGAGTSKNTFAYTLKAGTLAGDYTITKVEGDLTVTKAKYPGQEPGGAGIQWSVAAEAATWMYDGQPHGVTLTGVPSGVTPHLVGNTATDAGSYTASVTFDYDAANYEPPVAPAPLAWSITKRPVTLMAASKDKPYDGFPLEVKPGDITASGSGYAQGECFDYYDMASITEVGEIPATFSYRDSATAKVANYAVTVVGGQTLKVTVGGDQISVTADSATWAYDGTAHTLPSWTVFNGDKLLTGHAFQIKIDEASAVATPVDGPAGDGIVSNRFEYVKIVETASGADKTKNYNLLVYEGALQITNRVICSEELRVNGEEFTENIAKVYDGVATGAVVTASLLQPAAVRYWLAGGAAGAMPPQFTDAGDYTVWYEVMANYYDAYTGKVDVAIAKRPVTLTSPTKTKPYDGSPLTFAADEIAVGGDGFAEGESFAFSNFGAITDAGRVDSTFDYAAEAGTTLDNYDIAAVRGTLTVSASADEITVTAKSGSWAYDGSAHTLHDCEVVNGDVLQSGDELVVEYDTASAVTTPDDGEVANTITSVKVMRGNTDVTANYSIVTYPGTIKVVNATMAVDGSGFSAQATYDGEKHTIAVTAPTLLTSPVAVAYSETGEGPWKADPMAVGVKDAGTHTIRYRISAQYYNDFFGEATVTIAPRPVTLVSSGATKVYDGTPITKNEVLVKAGSLGFASGEGFSATCLGSLTDVGGMENLFDYTLNEGTKAGNYAITKEYGWLRVAPATLDAGAALGDDGSGQPLVCEKMFNGEAQPVSLEPNFDEPYRIWWALVAGDESAYSETPPTLRNVADGDLLVYFKFMSPNFEPYYGSVTFRIKPKTLTGDFVWLVLPTTDYVYDGTAKTLDVACGDGDPSIITTGDFDVSFDNNVNAGTATATFTGKGNYTGTATEDFEIKRRVVTLTSSDGNWTYDGLAHSNMTVTAAGFVDGEGVTTNGFATITDVGSAPNAFGYDFADGTLAANYNVSCVTGMLTVTKATIGPGGGGGGGGGGEPEEPGSGTVPVGGNSKFDASATYDGEGHTIDTNALAAAFAAAIVGDATVEYALNNGSDAPVLPWGAEVPVFTNAGEYIVWYCVTNSNYDDFVHKAKVTIAQRDIANATIAPIADIMYAGVAVEPVPVVADGTPSIIAATDYAVSYVGNNAPGTATVTLTGQGNYTGTKSATFEILSSAREVVLDALGGKIGGASVVTQECAAVYGALPAATRENYVFDGWFLGVTNGAPQAMSGGALLVDDDHALFARWSVDETLIPGGVAPTFSVESIDGGTCRITGFGGMTGTKLVIPDYIGGLAVTEIAMGAFANLANGLSEVVLPSFCTNIGDKAFLSVSTLTSISFANARRWDNPSLPATVGIGAYVFSGTALASITLPDCITSIGDYAFANCNLLSSMTILGHPAVGQMPFRRSGYGTAGGVEVHLDPALAGDTDFMDALRQQCANVTVRTDAVVEGVFLSSMSMSPRKMKLNMSVDRASSWGEIDTESVRVNYRESLGDEPVVLVPDSITDNGDGSFTVEVSVPEGQSGFFQATIGK